MDTESMGAKGFFYRAITILVIFVASGIFLECATRVVLWASGERFYGDYWYKPHRFLGYSLRPNTLINGPSSLSPRSKKTSINSLGFRGREFSVEKGDDVYRIICIGGSSTFCISSSDDEHTWPALLEDKLAKEYPEYTVEVINAGVPGWTTYESMINFAINALDYSPDMIIVYHGANDIAYCHKATQGFNYTDKPPISVLNRLVNNSAAYILLMKGWSVFATKVSGDRLPDTFDSYGLKVFRRNLQNIISIAKARNMKVILSSQATLVWENPKETDWGEIPVEILAWFGLSQKGLVKAYKEIYDTLEELSVENNIIFVDNAKKVPHTLKYLQDYAHLWDKGAEVVAKNFFETIKKEGLITQVVTSKN